MGTVPTVRRSVRQRHHAAGAGPGSPGPEEGRGRGAREPRARARARRREGQRRGGRRPGPCGRGARARGQGSRRLIVGAAPYDVLTMGRVGVDLYPLQSSVHLADVRTFAKSLGGSPTNVAVGTARYGHRAAVITKVGDDGFGAYVTAALRSFGVDDKYVGTDPNLRTPIVFCELFPPDSFPLLFYRES